MRFSKLYCPTLKEAPREAEVVSHQLMLRAGMIRKEASGIYSYLPLGYRILRKFEAIVRKEMNRAGAQEVHMPMVSSAELWKETGRWDKYGKELLRITDRHDNEFCLGPTHEEVITDIVRNEVRSYKQLPLNLYQIQTKFRDEIRPRFGLMRGREFYMKDSYSFERDEESLDTTYKTMADAYHRIFESCGLDFRMVEADNGSIGGSSSAEFMVLADTGEDTIMECKQVKYAANVEIHTDEYFQKQCPDVPLSELRETKGIEVGHIFKLGTTYSEQMKATFVDQDGQSKPFVMGCYGIGVSRTVAAAIEQNHDEKGIKWPKALSPYEVDIIVTNIRKDELREPAEALYQTLLDNDVDVLIDDRAESAGVKFKDADLIGFSTQVVFGKSWTENQQVELKDRMTGESKHCTVEEVINELLGR